MKTIAIIETEAVELEAMSSLFQQWRQDINVLTSSNQNDAVKIMSKHQVDLIVCDLPSAGDTGLGSLGMLTHNFPYIPCIALTDQQGLQKKTAKQCGINHCLEKTCEFEKAPRLYRKTPQYKDKRHRKRYTCPQFSANFRGLSSQE